MCLLFQIVKHEPDTKRRASPGQNSDVIIIVPKKQKVEDKENIKQVENVVENLSISSTEEDDTVIIQSSLLCT